MKPITVYEATDGSRWDTQLKAEQRDILHAKCLRAENPLGPRRDIPSEQFYQHSQANYTEAWERYVPIAKEHCGTTNSRVVMDSDSNDPVSRLCSRFLCIDKLCREWQQPYFVPNPPPNPKCINP